MRSLRLFAAVLGLGLFSLAASAQGGAASCGSNTYTIDNGGRLSFTLPPNMTKLVEYINYHRGASQGFDIRGGAITIPSGEGEIQAAGAIVLTASFNGTFYSGDTLELRQFTMEYFGNTPFITALVTYTPLFGQPQKNGRIPVFQVLRSSNSEIPYPCTASASVAQSFTVYLDPNFVAAYAPGGFVWPGQPSENFGTFLYQYGVDQEAAPTKGTN